MTVHCEIDGAVATLTLARPRSRNAIDTGLLTALEDVLQRLRRERAIDVVCLRAEGPVFCAGTDLKEVAGMSVAELEHWQARAEGLVQTWQQLDATTVSVLAGPAIGSGAVLALASDVRLGVEAAWLQLPELQHGLPLTWHGMAILCGSLGADRTHRALLFGERLELHRLQQWGCWDAVVTPDALDAALVNHVAQIQQAPALARRMTKRALRGWCGMASHHDPYLAAYAAMQQGHLRSDAS